jgi:hypothetical protein
MKIVPITSGNPSNQFGAVEGAGVSADKILRAKAIAAGETPIQVVESDTPQVKVPDVKRITMRTNATVDRYGTPNTQVVSEEAGEVSKAVESTNPGTDATPPVVEDTLPLSPQFAALAKQRRALQAKERELSDREKALTTQSTSVGVEGLVARLKSEPLSVLQEHGVTYDQLTEAILSNQSNPEIQSLKAEIKALKEGVDTKLSERDTQAEQQVLAEIQRDVNQRASSGDEYEMIRATGKQAEVKELIHRTWKETGEILDVSEAMNLVEDELVRDALATVNISKIKSKLQPASPPPSQQQSRQIRTLTNRDTASPSISRRDRAIAAALGTLKR